MNPRAPTSERLLDRHMPEWHFRERHRRHVAASPRQTLAAALRIGPRDAPLSSMLMAMRLAPAALAERRWPVTRGAPWIELFGELGLRELARNEHELVIGGVGRFWRLREELEPIADSAAFERFAEPGFAKAAVNFHAAATEDGAEATTETRVLALDAGTLRTFRRYWIPVRAAGELMRRELLGAVARRAEELESD